MGRFWGWIGSGVKWLFKHPEVLEGLIGGVQAAKARKTSHGQSLPIPCGEMGPYRAPCEAPLDHHGHHVALVDGIIRAWPRAVD